LSDFAELSHESKLSLRTRLTIKKIMFRKLYVAFGIGVVLIYMTLSWFGLEFANSGTKSSLGVPFIYTGFRGGK
jgi:hypothetical protein